MITIDEMQEEVREFDEGAKLVFSGIRTITVLFVRFAVMSIRTLLNPESEWDWKTAWMYFVLPVVMGGGSTVAGWLVILLLLPWPFDWMAVVVWLVFMAGQYYMFYIEGDGFERAERWIGGE